MITRFTRVLPHRNLHVFATIAFLFLLTLVSCFAVLPAGPLLKEFRHGAMSNVSDIVFCVRKPNPSDGHWYANFGYYAADPGRKAWQPGSVLCRMNLDTGKVTELLRDDLGGIRDPQVHYDGARLLFSYRPGGEEQYHLYEINTDGTGLKQLTSGAFDDIEPSYLADGGIVFVSSRCKRWVNCWLTQVAVLHRCDGDGKNIRAISSNNEHDNTPWPLPDGRILYTRWEYIDRSQVHFHHLWSANPDGSVQTVWFGNLNPGTTMIDAKPIQNSSKVVASFSPGHGSREHDGFVTVIDPAEGPDQPARARNISKQPAFRDPWAFDEQTFLAARGTSVILMNGDGNLEEIFRLAPDAAKAGAQCHEPRPLVARTRENVTPLKVNVAKASGRMVLANIYNGRNMAGISPGEIKKLLVLESLPMPIHYTGGMEPISYGGTFTLERIVGTVPVEQDGSAYFEVPALRSVFFVALDENNLSVKRMQSFAAVMPGEVLSCVGCHEHRTQSPELPAGALAAVQHAPSRIEPIADVPQVFDFPRDIQPILDRLCVSCHGYEKTQAGGPRAGRLILSGDHGPLYSHSYYMLTISGLFSDGRNQPVSNYAPRKLGSSNSRILSKLDGLHHEVKATPREKELLRLWIDSGAAYPGTYAALGGGMIGNYAENQQINTGEDWPESRAAAEVIKQRCASCHAQPSRLLPLSLADERGVSFWQPSLDDPRLLTSRHIVFNLSRPEKSLLLLAPLSREAGGWGLCTQSETNGTAPVFVTTSDAGYHQLLALCQRGKDFLEHSSTRFDQPNFMPPGPWVREMKRYGILPETHTGRGLNVYEVEQRYWQSLWYSPPAAPATVLNH